MEFSLVVTTLGRTAELISLFSSLEKQTFKSFEVIIVDQNADDRVPAILSITSWSFPVAHFRTPETKGASRGRNFGWRHATGKYLLFPDDDCWYPPWFLSKARDLFELTGADVISGRAAAEDGRSINGRYERRAQRITRRNVWTTQIEWVLSFKRSALESVDGFDEYVGVGAPTPWQSCEGQDIVLRALERNLICTFDPELYGHHAELDTISPDEAMILKGQRYGRGLGFVLRKHNFKITSAVYWISRPTIRGLIAAGRGKLILAAYHLAVARGRFEGWTKSKQYLHQK